MNIRTRIAGGVLSAAALVTLTACGQPDGAASAATQAVPVTATVTETVTKTAAPVTKTAAPVTETVTVAPAEPVVTAAADYQVTYRVTSVEGSEIRVSYDSGIYLAEDTEHGSVEVDPAASPVWEMTVTMHPGDMPFLYAQIGYNSPGKLVSTEIMVDGVVVETDLADNKGTTVSSAYMDL